MQSFLSLLLVSIAFLPLSAFASPTLDHFISPNEMIQELGLSAQAKALPPSDPPLTPQEVWERYGVDVFAEFPVVIIVDTAAEGETAQTVTVHQQGQVIATYLTSTGREQWEAPPSGQKYFSDTPVGWFSPQYFVKDHHSSIWNAPMELSIFFNGGIAIHATTPDLYEHLGFRASGGCVRLSKENAQAVWDLTVNLPKKEVPVFDVQGNLQTDVNGQVLRRNASAILILVVNSKPSTEPRPEPPKEVLGTY
jgi:hypothetical protein